MIKFTKKKTILITLTVILFITFALSLNPLRWSAESIERYILKWTPMNSSFDEVKTVIFNHDWELTRSSQSHGFYDQRHSPSKVTGDMHLQAYLGEYQGIPFTADVTVFWGFDKEGKLIDIWVWKTWNGF